jgi:hypothetical protein
VTTDTSLPSAAWQDVALPCPDEECVITEDVVRYRPDLEPLLGQRSIAEPDGDAETHCHACVTCGFEFNYVRMDATSISGESGTCQVGIPESVRRAAAGFSEPHSHEQPAGPPLLQIGKRPPDEQR